MSAGEVVLGFLLAIVTAEFVALSPWFAELIAKTATKFLPKEQRPRYRREWLAELDLLRQRGGRVSLLVIATRIFLGAPNSGRQLERLPPYQYSIAARFLDCTIAGTVLLLSAPLLCVLGVAVRLSSRGPVIYRAERVGMNGKPIITHKFRTLRLREEDKQLGPVWSSEKDPTVTRLGTFMRRHELDNLPTLWNVLRGDLSLVGPDYPHRMCPEVCRKSSGVAPSLDV